MRYADTGTCWNLSHGSRQSLAFGRKFAKKAFSSAFVIQILEITHKK
jgi:hypothetical protein